MDDTLQTVDLTNCDREPIHLLGRVQEIGFLIGLTREWRISHVSENVGEFLPGYSPQNLIGKPISELVDGQDLQTIKNYLQQIQSGGSGLVGHLKFDDVDTEFEVTTHLSDKTIIIEAEPAQALEKLEADISNARAAINRLAGKHNLEQMFEDSVRFVRMMTGFDRVMFYKFHQDGSGEVVAEARRSDLQPYLTLRYPATDIPRQARALYIRNPIRIIADVWKSGAKIVTENGRTTELDLSDSVLRAVSEIHLEYLRNMGVGASMSISIIVDGQLWGLLACHHYAPMVLSQSKRNAALLFGQMFSLLLQSQLGVEERRYDDSVLDLTNWLSRNAHFIEDTSDLLERAARESQIFLGADGVAILMDGSFKTHGATPSPEQCAEIGRWLGSKDISDIFHTNHLSDQMSRATDFQDKAAGLLAIPISHTPKDYILFFRRELIKKVTWAGDPEKPAEMGPNGVRLTPRKSFEAWQQTVGGQSEEWNSAEIRAAAQLRVVLLEVVLRMSEQAAFARKSANEKQEVLIAELNHRVRNILGLVRGLISQSNATDLTIAEFVNVLDGRVQALARAHDQITRQNWSPASLRELIRVEAESYLLDKHSRVIIEGEDAMLVPAAFSTMALVMHELITNSAKYGALSDQRGQVDIKFSRDENQALIVEWEESGGPPVKAPTRRGFGTTIIQKTVPFELRGKSDIEYAISGLKARFLLPAEHITEAHKKPNRDEKPSDTIAQGDGAAIAPSNVMIVEDNLIIAMEAEDIMSRLGAQKIDIFANVDPALAHLGTERCDFALLDINLGTETSFPVAHALIEKGIPFAFASGYGEDAKVDPAFEDYETVSKPYDLQAIRSLLKRLKDEDSA